MVERIGGRGEDDGATTGDCLWRWREELELEGQDDSRGGERGLNWAKEEWNVEREHEL